MDLLAYERMLRRDTTKLVTYLAMSTKERMQRTSQDWLFNFPVKIGDVDGGIGFIDFEGCLCSGGCGGDCRRHGQVFWLWRRLMRSEIRGLVSDV